eukprot:jgi/Botrbrau1/9993/Bobra.0012s0082.1
MRDLSRLNFDYAEKRSPDSEVVTLSMGLQVYRPEHVLLASYHVPLRYDPAAIQAVIAEMTPGKARLLWSSRDFKDQLNEVEPWYGTPFSREPLPGDWVNRWEAAVPGQSLHLPRLNPFVPHDFALVQGPEARLVPPCVIKETHMVRVWHKADTSFRMPKAVLFVSLMSPPAYSSPEAAVLSKLACTLLTEHLNSITYEAELAGLSFTLSNSIHGLGLLIKGYSDKLDVLALLLLKELVAQPPNLDRFEVMKEKVKKEYLNTRYDQPYQQALYGLNVLLEVQRWHIDDYLAVIDGLQAEDLQALYRQMRKRMFVEVYMTGNYTAERTLKLVADMEQFLAKAGTLPLLPSERPEARVLQLPQGQPVLFEEAGTNPANDNSALIVFFQVGPDDLPRNAANDLLVTCTKRDAFYRLRTVEQLGYITWFTGWSMLGVEGIAAIIQSAAFSALHCEQRVDAFLDTLRPTLSALSDSAFSAHVEELAKSKLEKPKRLGQQAARDWSEIKLGTLRFDRPEAEVAALRQLTRADLLSFLEEYVEGPLRRRRLSVRIRGAAEVSVDASGPAPSPADTGIATDSPPALDVGPPTTAEQGAPQAGDPSSRGEVALDANSGGEHEPDGPSAADGMSAPDEEGIAAEGGGEDGDAGEVGGSGRVVGADVPQANGPGNSSMGGDETGGRAGQGEEAMAEKGADGHVGGGMPKPLVVTDIWGFKSRMAVFPSFR